MEWNDRMENGSKRTQLQLTCVTDAAYSVRSVPLGLLPSPQAL